jgi:hypothetical protein
VQEADSDPSATRVRERCGPPSPLTTFVDREAPFAVYDVAPGAVVACTRVAVIASRVPSPGVGGFRGQGSLCCTCLAELEPLHSCPLCCHPPPGSTRRYYGRCGRVAGLHGAGCTRQWWHAPHPSSPPEHTVRTNGEEMYGDYSRMGAVSPSRPSGVKTRPYFTPLPNPGGSRLHRSNLG